MAAFVGPSGAGKTTITQLVPRFYDPQHGAVLVDGHDVRDVTLASLGEHVGMVNQEPFLFHTSIRQNLRYAKPEATDAEVEAAARAANIHEFVAGLPYGYDTIVGERGYRLSGGEKQRIAIARTLLRNPRVLVLDEATSSLDNETERAVQQALDQLARLHAIIKHGRAYLTKRLEDPGLAIPTDTPIAAWLGGERSPRSALSQIRLRTVSSGAGLHCAGSQTDYCAGLR